MFIVKHMEALQGTDEISVFSRHHPPTPPQQCQGHRTMCSHEAFQPLPALPLLEIVVHLNENRNHYHLLGLGWMSFIQSYNLVSSRDVRKVYHK